MATLHDLMRNEILEATGRIADHMVAACEDVEDTPGVVLPVFALQIRLLATLDKWVADEQEMMNKLMP